MTAVTAQRPALAPSSSIKRRPLRSRARCQSRPSGLGPARRTSTGKIPLKRAAEWHAMSSTWTVKPAASDLERSFPPSDWIGALVTPGEGTHRWAVEAEDAVVNRTWCNEVPGGTPGVSFRIDDTGPGDPALSGGGVFEVASANIPDNLNDRALDTGLNIAAGE